MRWWWPVAERGTGGNRELVFNGMEFSVWEDEKVLQTNSDDGCTTM